MGIQQRHCIYYFVAGGCSSILKSEQDTFLLFFLFLFFLFIPISSWCQDGAIKTSWAMYQRRRNHDLWKKWKGNRMKTMASYQGKILFVHLYIMHFQSENSSLNGFHGFSLPLLVSSMFIGNNHCTVCFNNVYGSPQHIKKSTLVWSTWMEKTILVYRITSDDKIFKELNKNVFNSF